MVPVQDPYRRHASGLLVPADISREREVWTRAEWKAIEKATKLLESRGVHVYLGCPENTCKANPLERIRRTDGGITLRCNHKDREFHSHL